MENEAENVKLCLEQMECELKSIKVRIATLNTKFKILNSSILTISLLSFVGHTIGITMQNPLIAISSIAALLFIPFPGMKLDKVDKEIKKLKEREETLKEGIRKAYFIPYEELLEYCNDENKRAI